MSEPKVLARGTVLVDPRKAVEKLRAFQLAQPGLYVLEVVRAATLLGATELTLENDSDDLALSWEGAAPTSASLLNLLDHLFDATDRALRLLAVAVNAALGLRPSFVDLYTTAHDGLAEDQLARVRYTAQGGVLGEGALTLVARSNALPRKGFRIHVRERFGAAVMAEWLRREPAETSLLRARLLAPRVKVAREGAPLRAAPTAALASVDLERSSGVTSALHLVTASATPAALMLCELGVLLERRDLEPEDHAAARRARFPLAAMPLHLSVDADLLDTNISRSQVDLDRGLGALLRRGWVGALRAVIDAGLARTLAEPLDGPARLAGEEALLALALWAHGERWAEDALRVAPEVEAEALELGALHPAVLAPLRDAPLVPTPFGGRCSLRALAASRGQWAAWTDDEPLAPELSPWLRDVVWAPPSRPVLRELLGCVETRNGARALAEARESMKRWRALMAHPARPVRVLRGEKAVLRASFADAETPPGLEGELALFDGSAAPEPRSITASVYLDGRPFCDLDFGPSPLHVRVAVQSPNIAPRPSFDGVIADGGLLEAKLETRARLVRVLADALQRDAFSALPEATRAAFVRGAWVEARDVLSDQADLRAAMLELGRRHPALLDAPAWRLTSGGLASTRELLDDAALPGRTVMTGDDGTGPRWDARPVFVLDEPSREALTALLEPAVRWVDMGGYLPARQSISPGKVAAAASPSEGFAWRDLASPHARLSASPAVTPKSTLVVMHSGQVVFTRARVERLGPSVIAVEDDALVPTRDPALSPEAEALVARAEHELAEALCAALLGDGAAREALAWTDGPQQRQAAQRFLLAALGRLRRATGEGAALRARIESVPLVPRRAAGGGVQNARVAALRDELTRAGADELHFLVEPPRGVDGEDFTPLILPTKELQQLVANAVGARVESADAKLRAVRAARARREAREGLRALPREGLDERIEGRAPTRLAPSAHADVAYALSSDHPEGSARVLFDGARLLDRVAVAGAQGVVARVALRDDALLTEDLRGLTREGVAVVEAEVRRAALHAVSAVLERAERDLAVDAASRATLCAWVNARGAKVREGRELDDGRIRAAMVWRDPAGEPISIDNARGAGRAPRVILHWAAPWLPPGAGEEPDPPTLSLSRQSELDAVRALCKRVRDVTQEARITQRRRAFERGDGRAVRLPGDPPAPWATARLDGEVPGPCRGEVRLARRQAGAEVSVFEDGVIVSRVRVASPVALDLALASPELEGSTVEAFVRDLGVLDAATRLARRMLTALVESRAQVPEWATRALRWHLCTAESRTPLEEIVEVFSDTLGRGVSLRGLREQRERFATVAYVHEAPDELVSSGEPGRRVTVLHREEVEWLGRQLPLADHRAALDDAVAAARWARQRPVARLTVPDPPSRLALRCELTQARDGAEGELLLLAWDAPDEALAYWFHERRPLGRSPFSAPWPSRVALAAPGLTPRRDRAGPEDDDGHRAAQERARALVLRALARELGPRPGESLADLNVHEGRSPAISGGVAQAVGSLWLTRDGAPGEITVRVGDAVHRVPAVFAQEKARAKKVAAPISGAVWLRKSAGARRDAWEPMLERVLAWSWRKLLDAWIQRTEVDLGADASLTHLLAAGLAGQLGGPAADLARRAKLPDSPLTVSRAVTLAKQGHSLRAVHRGDPPAKDAVTRARARWFELLETSGMIAEPEVQAPAAQAVTPEAAPAQPPRPAAPTPKPATPRAPATRAEQLSHAALARLRALDVNHASLREIRVRATPPGDAPMGYSPEQKRVWLRAETPWVRAALEDPERHAEWIAMAALGEANRALEDITDAHEVSALRAMLRDRAGR